MVTTVRLNFAKPPGILGLLNIGNTQTMKAGKKGDKSIVINVAPSRHLNADGSFKKLDQLINDPALDEKERNAFLALKSAEHVELLGHGAAGGDAIYSNPAQNFPTSNSTSWYGETEYKAEAIAALLADCDKGPDINVISCHGASKKEGQSICTRLRSTLNKKALANGKPTGAIKGYTRACGINNNGGVFLSVNSQEDRKCSAPWWSRIPIIGALLSFLANLWDALTGGGGPRKGTVEYEQLKAQAEKDSVLVDDNRVGIRQRSSETAEIQQPLSYSQEKEKTFQLKQAREQKADIKEQNLQMMKGTLDIHLDSMSVNMTSLNDMTDLQSGPHGLDVLPTTFQHHIIYETVECEKSTELSL